MIRGVRAVAHKMARARLYRGDIQVSAGNDSSILLIWHLASDCSWGLIFDFTTVGGRATLSRPLSQPDTPLESFPRPVIRLKNYPTLRQQLHAQAGGHRSVHRDHAPAPYALVDAKRAFAAA